MFLSRGSIWPVAWVLIGSACSPSQPLAVAPSAPGARCSIAASQDRPLIVEWSASDRMDLETNVRQGGAVVVRYTGCEMEMLRNCKAPAEYKYLPGTRQDERVTMRNADELYAKMPIGAAGLEAMVEKGNELSVSMSVVGKYVAPAESVRLSDLKGTGCAGATHVVVGLTTGSFEMASGASSSAAAGVGVAGGRTSRETNVLRRGGSTQACDRSTSRDAEPPEGCSAFLRLELTPLQCPGALTWVDGKGCVSRWEGERPTVALTGQSDAGDASLASLLVEASYTLLGVIQGKAPDPKFRVDFKDDEAERREAVEKAGLGPNPPLQLVISSVRGSSPTTDGKEVVGVKALFHVFPPGEVRWGGLSVDRSPVSPGEESTGPSFGDAQPAWLSAHDRVVRAFAANDCVIAPAVAASDLAAVPLTSEQRRGLDELVPEFRFDAQRCNAVRGAKGPWRMEETRMYAAFGDGKTGFVLFAVMVPKRNEIELYDAKVSFIGD